MPHYPASLGSSSIGELRKQEFLLVLQALCRGHASCNMSRAGFMRAILSHFSKNPTWQGPKLSISAVYLVHLLTSARLPVYLTYFALNKGKASLRLSYGDDHVLVRPVTKWTFSGTDALSSAAQERQVRVCKAEEIIRSSQVAQNSCNASFLCLP